MDASDSDHSISGNISIPHWMKSRVHDRYDVELGALSPPNQDDSFFYIPYNKFTQPEKSSAAPSVIIANPHPSTASLVGTSEGSSSLLIKHTEPCLKYLKDTKIMDTKEPLAIMEKGDEKLPKLLKSLGTDDGFKGEAAQCGHSVVQVAQQIIAERFVGRPVKLGSEDDAELAPAKHRMRRGSKSLPASPLATPDSTPHIQRKNRFFTGPFVETPEESTKFPGGWLVAGLFGAYRENLSESQSDLTSDDNNNAKSQSEMMQVSDSLKRNTSSVLLRSMEKPKFEDTSEVHQLSLHHSHSAAVLTKSGNAGSSTPPVKPRPKASELREMNFWSPTSM